MCPKSHIEGQNHKNTCFKGQFLSKIWMGGNLYFSMIRGRAPLKKTFSFGHCLNDGGGSDPCLDFCEGFVHMH